MSRIEHIGNNVTLYLGDCLETIGECPMADVIITDPPFSSGARTDAGKSVRGAMLRGDKWKDDWFSHDNLATHGFLFLMRLVGLRLLQQSNPGARAHFFIDWRMYPNLYGALEASSWVVKNLVVWDKCHFGMGTNYRNQHELIIYAEKGMADFPNHSSGNVIKCPRESAENHPTEKPISLIESLIVSSSVRGEMIFDPFMGSGTTGVAAVKTGRAFCGIEIDERHFDTACSRIEAAQKQPDFFVEKIEQRAAEIQQTLDLAEAAPAAEAAE